MSMHMMLSKFQARFVSALVALVAFGFTACAEPDDIDRVQPNLIRKADLEGEWYAMGTVLRAPFASHYVFPGLQGNLERGIWEVQRDHLVFYRTYEGVEGSDSQGIRADVDTPILDADGQPLTYEKIGEDGEKQVVTRYVYRASPLKKFPIVGHYDVRRNYNPMTGEQGNVIVEDASEKYWFEREYMRVDFGKNTANNFKDMAFGLQLPATMTFYEGEEGPEELRLKVEEDYLDFVVRGLVVAPTTYLSGWGYVPTCLFIPWYTGSYFECDEEEIHIRSSFMRVPETTRYADLEWNDHMMNRFGYFRSARPTWDEFYGQTYSAAHRKINRFRIWEEILKDDEGKIDYAQMTVRPIVYHLSEAFPRELIGGALELAEQWNVPFVELVETRTGRPYTEADGRVFVLCENSAAEVDALLAQDPNAILAETDPEICGDMDQPKRLGDLRYNLLHSVNAPVQYGLYGYGPSHSDPITGETVSADSHMYSANIRRGARRAVDMIEYEAGVQNFRDITSARHIESSVKADRVRGMQNEPAAGRNGSVQAFQAAAAQVMQPMQAMNFAQVGAPATDRDLASAGMTRVQASGAFGYAWLNDAMAAAVGMPIEKLGEQSGPNAQVLDSLIGPAALGTDAMLRWQEDMHVRNGQQAMCKEEFFDSSIRGLALEFKSVYDQTICDGLLDLQEEGEDLVFDFDVFRRPQQSCEGDPGVCGPNATCQAIDQGEVQGRYCVTACNAGDLFDQLRKEIRRVNQVASSAYWDPNALYTTTKDERVAKSQKAARELVTSLREEVFLDIYDRIWSTVAMHEVGHNLGLRHNFASSTDALNFFPEYWDLKGSGDGSSWTPHRLFEVDSDEQVRRRMREYQQSSIMEYSSAFNAAFQGVGAYDRAAILYGYGELVEVFDEAPDFADWAPYLADPSDDSPDMFRWDARRVQPLARALEKIHHTNYPQIFGGTDAIQARRVVDIYETADLDRPCSQHDSPYDSEVCGGGGAFCTAYPDGFYCSKPDQVQVPYRFCSDEYNWSGANCQVWDEGVDLFEIAINTIEDYTNYWPFWGYKRDNDLFDPSTSYWGRVMYQMAGMRKIFEHWALDYTRYNKDGWWEGRYGQPWHLDVNGGLGATLAVKEVFTHLANIFGRPSDTIYGFNTKTRAYEPIVENGFNTYRNVIQLREDVGARPIYPSYDFDGYIYTPYRAGTFYDRLAALMYMSFPTTMFTSGVDYSYDLKRFRLNFASVWPQRVQNLFSGIIAGRPEMYGWCIVHDGVPPTELDDDGRDGRGTAIGVKPRLWFGETAELDSYYSNCVPLEPEPLYDFPTTQYRLPAVAAIYGFGWMGQTYDRSFVDRNRLWLEGDGSDVTIPSDFATVQFTDPYSGKVYTAAYDPAEEDPYAEVGVRSVIPDEDFTQQRIQFWPAARLVVEAERRLDQLQQSNEPQYRRAYQEIIGRLEIVRGLYRLYDFGY